MTNAVVQRLPEVRRRTGLSRTSIYNRIKDGSFPQGFSLGGRSRGWLESEVTAWIIERAESRHSESRAVEPTKVRA